MWARQEQADPRVAPPKRHKRPTAMPVCTSSRVCVAALLAAVALIATRVQAQDLLRRNVANMNNANSNNLNAQQLNSLANIQLPPQLASLTPQQLHQLAQLRELQLAQEAANRQRDDAAALAGALAQQQNAPAPIGLEAATSGGGGGNGGSNSAASLPTAQPAAGPASGQIPRPGAGSETTPTNNERHDDGSYNEAGSEMEGVAMSSGANSAAPSSSTTPASSGSNDSAAGNSVSSSAPTFEVNWNKCPQLEPSESEKSKKTQVITKCLQAAPIPSNLTRENVEAHREQIATCALKVEGWFDESGQYKYDKAESEIRAKRLDQAIESQVLKFHVACKDEASKKFPHDQNKLIDQVQFYQACMDYYISIVCEIEVSVDQ